MVDLLIILFLIIFWVISYTLKQSGKSDTKYEESDRLREFFKFPELEIIPERLKYKDKAIENITAHQSEPKEAKEDHNAEVEYREPVIKEELQVIKIDSRKLYHNMLKSKTSLKKAIVIKEILDKPISLR